MSGGGGRIKPPSGFTTCNAYRDGVQTSHLVALDENGRNWGRPTVCGLTRFDARDPDTYEVIRPADLPGWSMGVGGLFGPDIAQVPCAACFNAACSSPSPGVPGGGEGR